MITNRDLGLKIKTMYDRRGISSATMDIKKFAGITDRVNVSQKKQLSGIASAWKAVSSGLKSIGSISYSVFSGMLSGINSVFNAVFSLKTLIFALFAGIATKGISAFIGLNAEFEKMKVQMDVLTKGQGEAWFNKLNQWALSMPISMQEVSKAFVTMQAYGLTPSIKLMETMVDVASVLPESGRAITGIARAIGQIQAKSRLEGQELRQLAEWAVPGYEAVYTKIFKKISERTGKAVSELKFTMIDSSTAIKAILETMEEHFGGAAKRIATTWSGLMTRLTNYVKEFFRQIGEAGIMAPLKEQLENIINWAEKAFKSGEMQKATKLIGSSLTIAFEGIFEQLKVGRTFTINWAETFTSVMEKMIYATTIFINTLSGIKLVLLTIKYAWLLFAIGFNAVLYGLIYALDKFIQGFRYLVDLLPTAIPGVESLQKAFKDTADQTAYLTEQQGINITLLGQELGRTGEDIASTANLMTDRWNIADKTVTKLRENLKKYKETEAIAPIAPKVIEGAGFVETAMKPPILTEEEAKKHKKAIDAMRKENIAWMLENGSLWTQLGLSLELYLEDLEKTKLKRAGALFKTFFNSIGNTFQTAFSSIIKGTMNLSEGFHSIFENIRDSFLDMISTMIFEWAKGKAIMLLKELFFQKAVTVATAQGEAERLAIESTSAIKSIAIAVASGVKQIMISAYVAAANAFKAIAGIPFVGPFLAIGAGATALGLVMGFAKKVSSFEKGTGLGGIKETGPAVLHKGEIVMTRKESDIFRGMMEDKEKGIGAENNISLSFSISALDGSDVERIVKKKVIPILKENLRDYGMLRGAVKAI